MRHHAADHGNGVSGKVDTQAQGWYRFLSGHDPAVGAKGFENGLWEAGLHDGTDHSGVTQHNEYLGVNHGGYRNYTITGMCIGCHLDLGFGSEAHTTGQTHSGNWIRHPSDSVIPNSGEYADAGGASHSYDPLTPVSRPSVYDSPSGTINVGTDMVMCLSCHRPHGSPNPDMLRWNYMQQMAGGGDNSKGCFFCHTEKDN